MIRRYYYKEISGLDREAAHFYEHLFVYGFERLVEERGLTIGLYGWVYGSTYNDIILIETGFYDQRAAKLFEEYLQKPLAIMPADIDSTTEVIAAEWRSELKINRADLEDELAKIDERPFHELESSLILKRYKCEPKNSKIIKQRDRKNHFKKCEIVFLSPKNDSEEIAVMTRLWPILVDQTISLINQHRGYAIETHAPVSSNHDREIVMSVDAGFRKRGFSAQELKASLEEMQKRLVLSDRVAELRQYITEFQKDNDFAHIPEQILDETGIFVSRKKIAELFTPQRVQKVWDALKVGVKG